MYYYKTDLRTSGLHDHHHQQRADDGQGRPAGAAHGDVHPGPRPAGPDGLHPRLRVERPGRLRQHQGGHSGRLPVDHGRRAVQLAGAGRRLADRARRPVACGGQRPGRVLQRVDPNSLADGLAGALSALHVQTAAASASATSSPNITQTDNFIYSSTFRTVKWDGEIVAQHIDPTNGNVLPPIAWSAQSLLDTRPAPPPTAARSTPSARPGPTTWSVSTMPT